MKKSSLFGALFLALLVPFEVAAQEFSFGGRAQGGYVVLNADDASADEAIDGRFGFGLGAQALVILSSSYGFQLEAGWARRGASSSLRFFEIEGATTGVEQDFTLDYLEIPILFRLHLQSEESRVTPKVMLGPYVAAFVTGKVRGTGFGLSVESDLEAGEDIDFFDVGAVLAVGADVELDAGLSLTADVRVQHGLTGVEVNDGDSALANLALLLNLGVAFGI